MRILKIFAVAVVLGAGAIAAPIRLDPGLSGNTTNGTTSFGVFPSILRCVPNFGPGVNLTNSEAISMEYCFNNTFTRTQWYDTAVQCPQTNRVWQIWGHRWNQPEHCWAACNECILNNIRAKAANVNCNKIEGVMALCHITYDTAPPYAKWPPDEPPPPSPPVMGELDSVPGSVGTD
ncbi:hypothetical protein F4776DRAFT_338006 [Hypoxylon sp. NC0597]|nr:hypothetical protein F4776DRAFT_338006 [Hypoxylon sp. NC0597]